jgi:cytochrome c-type biogenesis protein CcmH/NrfF
MTISRFPSVLFLVLFASLAVAETAEQQQARVDRLEHAVLAPCCYTESVAIHQSEIALKMRLEIVKWVATGKSDQEILDTYAGLYGAKVLVDPRTAPRWWMVWVPWLALAFGVAGGFWLLQRWKTRPGPGSAPVGDQFVELPDLDDE